jgi:AcrR family transcriptional regulator
MSVYLRPQREDVRRAVIRAAADLFVRQGYNATTLGQVAAAAGFTKGAIYSNFGGKPELFAAAVSEQFASRAGQAIDSASALGGDRTHDLARQLADLAVTDRWSLLTNEFRIVAQHDAGVAAVYAELRQRYQDDLAARLEASATSLGLHEDVDFRAAATLLLTVISGMALEHQIAPETSTREAIESVMDQLIRGLRS